LLKLNITLITNKTANQITKTFNTKGFKSMLYKGGRCEGGAYVNFYGLGPIGFYDSGEILVAKDNRVLDKEYIYQHERGHLVSARPFFISSDAPEIFRIMWLTYSELFARLWAWCWRI